MKTTVIVEKGKDGNFSAYSLNLKNHFLIGVGKTVEEAKNDFLFAYNDMILSYFDKDEPVPCELQELSFEYNYNISAFFNKYNWINLTQFSKTVEISPSLMRQYKHGQYISEKQISKIEMALHNVANELLEAKLIC